MAEDAAAAPRLRIGVDVGGTFTDFVMADLAGGLVLTHKEPSVPDAPSRAVVRGVAALLDAAGAAPGAIALIVHGTTLALNAIIQGRGARVALVVSRGNRDVMELARGRLPNSYDFRAGRERPLVPREDVFEVSARGLADGTVLRDVDEGELDALAARLAEEGYSAVAVMLLNSYRSGALEARVAAGLARRLPRALVTASAALWPELREYERALVAGLNAHIHPLMTAYLDRLVAGLAEIGVRAPVTITANNGGTMSVATARSRPIDTILSGPASGVAAAARTGRAHRLLLTFDMGGTSTDVAAIEDGALDFARTSMVGDYPLMLPVVNVTAIGAGGGSLARLDAQGVLRVGPDSAGADPGPVAYGRGGTVPTITDALLALGILHPDRFLGGRMPLDGAAARGALADLAQAGGLKDAEAAAVAILDVATARMGSELTKFLAQKGADPREAVLVAYGGAGPSQANILAEEAHLDAVLVPASPGTFCAEGALVADVRRDFVAAIRAPVGGDHSAWPTVLARLVDLEAEARAWIAGEGEIVRGHAFEASADMRYPGQAYELAVPLARGADGTADEAAAVEAFHRAHERVYGFREPGSAVELMTLRLVGTGLLEPVTLPPAREAPVPEPFETRRIGLREGFAAPVYRREAIGRGAILDGPLIVEQADSTTLVLPGWRLEADEAGNLVLRRRA